MAKNMIRGLPFYGGKSKMAAKIIKLLPPHTLYVEPFVVDRSRSVRKELIDKVWCPEKGFAYNGEKQ